MPPFGRFFCFQTMISLEKFKSVLEENGVKDLSDEGVLKLRDQQDQMAEIFFDMWLAKINKKDEL